MNINVTLLLVVTILLNAVAQIALKLGASSALAEELGTRSVPTMITQMLITPFVWVGLSIYAVSAVLWIIVLSKMDVSRAYPSVALTYIVVLLASWALLHESVSVSRWIAVGVICIGVVLLSRT